MQRHGYNCLLSPIYHIGNQLLYYVWGHLIQDTSIRVRKSEMVRLGFGDMDPTGGEATWRGIGDTHAIVDTVAASRAEFI